MPFACRAPAIEELHRLVYADDWARSDLGGPTWMATPEARALLEDPAAMGEVTQEQLARGLTVVVRLEWFSEEAMAVGVRRGLVACLLRRAAALAVVAPEPRYDGGSAVPAHCGSSSARSRRRHARGIRSRRTSASGSTPRGRCGRPTRVAALTTCGAGTGAMRDYWRRR